MRRRDFVKRLAPAVAAVRTLDAYGTPFAEHLRRLAGDLAAAPDDEAFWRRVRTEFLLNPGVAHLNCGTLGATPRPVLDAVTAALYAVEGNPSVNVFGPVGAQMEDVRARAAAFLGAALDEVVLTRNTTEGMNLVATGLDLQPGDEILTTNHEHPGGRVCWDHLVERRGVRIVEVPMPAPARDAAEIVQRMGDHLTARTRVCSVSHVCTITGLQMPLAALAERMRPRGVLLVCDGAQAPGMLSVDVKALGVDTYASSSHKWMLAPKGSGLLYVRKEVQDRIRPVFLHAGYRAYTASSGTRNVPQILGHGAALAFHETIGRDRVEQRCRALNRLLRDRLDRLPALQRLTPAEEELASGIVSYRLLEGTNREVAQALAARDLVVKVIPKPELNGLRFSTHIFNSESDVHRLADALAE